MLSANINKLSDLNHVFNQPGRAKLRAGDRVLQQLRENHGGRTFFRVLAVPREGGRGRCSGRALASTGGKSRSPGEGARGEMFSTRTIRT